MKENILDRIVMTDTVGIADVKIFLTEVFRKQGIELATLGLIALDPVDNPKYIFVSMKVRIPIGSEMEIKETEN